jgi:hypothetical protein
MVSDLAGGLRSHGTLSEPRWQALRVGPFLRRILREPLLHFFALGLLLFVAGEWHRSVTDPHRIVIDRAKVAKLAANYRLQYGTPPGPTELAALVDRYIDDEVFFREGQALGLGDGDEIVRRRVVQKMQFLVENSHAPAEPSDGALRAFYRSHEERYRLPERRSFTHVFFSPDRGGEAAAWGRALAVLASLKPAAIRAPGRGDAFPDLYDYSGYGPGEATRLFGHSELAAAVFTAPVGQWSGPYRSGYGIHLLRVQSVVPAQLPDFAAIRERVRADYLADLAQKTDATVTAGLRAKYTIVLTHRSSEP